MSELTTRAVVLDAQTNVAHLVLRELARAQDGAQTFRSGARRLYEETRLALLIELRERLAESLSAEVIALVEAEIADYERAKERP